MFPSAEDVGAMVLDVGQLYVKAGSAGDDGPKHFAYSLTGRKTAEIPARDGMKQDGLMDEESSCSRKMPFHPNRVFPVSLIYHQPDLDIFPCLYQRGKENDITGMPTWDSISSPIQPLELDKEGFETMVSHIFSPSTGLNVDIKGRPLLFADPNRHNRKLRDLITEILFETFSAEALYAAKRAVLNAFAVGRSGGLVIDVGTESTSITPVQEGYIIQNHIVELPVGGNLMDYQLAMMLKMAGMTSLTPLYKVKKKVRCDVDLSFSVDSATVNHDLLCQPSFSAYSERETLRRMKEAVSVVSDDPIPATHFTSFGKSLTSLPCSLFSQLNSMSFQSQQRYTLPDGVVVNCEKLYGKIAECVFNFECILERSTPLPSTFMGFSGLPQAVAKCIMDSDVDIRRDLLSALIICGGPVMTPGFIERMNRQFQDSEGVLGHGLKYKVVSPSSSLEKPYLSWIGGSILASLNSFQNMWVSCAEYAEHGPCVMERMCL